MEQTKQGVFDVLYKVNVNENTEKKDGYTYLPWTYAWKEVKTRFPDAKYEIDHYDHYVNGVFCGKKPFCYEEYTGYMVSTWVKKTVNQADMHDIHRSIMRCLVKNLGMFGLGLYIYSGEELPEGEVPVASIKQTKPDFPADGTPDNNKAMKYVNENVKKGADFIINMLEKKYTISDDIKIKINEL